jgi:hypothetical protein
MLIGDYIIFVFRVDGLVMGWDVDLIVGKFVFTEVFEEVGVSRAREVDVGVGGVFGLARG